MGRRLLTYIVWGQYKILNDQIGVRELLAQRHWVHSSCQYEHLGKECKLPELSGEMIPALSTPEGGSNQDKMSQ